MYPFPKSGCSLIVSKPAQTHQENETGRNHLEAGLEPTQYLGNKEAIEKENEEKYVTSVGSRCQDTS